jgi:hypothetical protein
MVAGLFQPLGWSVETAPIPLDETVLEWGDCRYFDVHMRGTAILSHALSHLYVLPDTRRHHRS